MTAESISLDLVELIAEKVGNLSQLGTNQNL